MFALQGATLEEGIQLSMNTADAIYLPDLNYVNNEGIRFLVSLTSRHASLLFVGTLGFRLRFDTITPVAVLFSKGALEVKIISTLVSPALARLLESLTSVIVLLDLRRLPNSCI
jgi:hypothetical protein